MGSLQVTENELVERKRLKTEERPEEAEHLGKEQEHGEWVASQDKAPSPCVPSQGTYLQAGGQVKGSELWDTKPHFILLQSPVLLS